MATKTGRVNLKNGMQQKQSYLARENADGTLSYYLGAPLSRTSDGWVDLSEDHRSKVEWDRREPEAVNVYATEQDQ